MPVRARFDFSKPGWHSYGRTAFADTFSGLPAAIDAVTGPGVVLDRIEITVVPQATKDAHDRYLAKCEAWKKAAVKAEAGRHIGL